MNADDGVVVAVAGPVVAEDPLLGGGLDVLEPRRDAALLVADVLALGQRDGALEDVERGPGVAAGERDEVVEGVVGQGDAALGPERAGQAALGVGERPPDDGRRRPRRTAARAARPASATGGRRSPRSTGSPSSPRRA